MWPFGQTLTKRTGTILQRLRSGRLAHGGMPVRGARSLEQRGGSGSFHLLLTSDRHRGQKCHRGNLTKGRYWPVWPGRGRGGGSRNSSTPNRRASLASLMVHFGSGGHASSPAAMSDWFGNSTMAPTPNGTTA